MIKVCRFLKDGVEFDNGKFLPYTADLNSISPDHIAELQSNNATGWSMFLLHRSIDEMRIEVTKHLICPANPIAIQMMIENAIKKQPRVVWKRAIDIFKDITVIITLLGLVFTLLGIIHINK